MVRETTAFELPCGYDSNMRSHGNIGFFQWPQLSASKDAQAMFIDGINWAVGKAKLGKSNTVG